jgi:hypothetical protein
VESYRIPRFMQHPRSRQPTSVIQSTAFLSPAWYTGMVLCSEMAAGVQRIARDGNRAMGITGTPGLFGPLYLYQSEPGRLARHVSLL